MDFITEVSNQNDVIIGMVVSFVAIILCAITAIVLYGKNSAAWFTLSFFGVVFGVIGLAGNSLTLLASGGNPTQTVYHTEKFKAWVSDEYLLEINDTQANSLLRNTVNKNNPNTTNSVYVTTYDGEDALANLFHEDDEWRLIVHQNIAISSN